MIRLGYIIEGGLKGKLYEIDPKILTRHACIFGVTGSGKSTTLKILSYELNKLNIPCLILDRTGEFGKHLPKYIENSYVYIPSINFSLSPFYIWENYEIEERVQNEVFLLNEYCKITWKDQFSPLQTRILIDTLQELHEREEKINFDILLKKIIDGSNKKGIIWKEAYEAIISRFFIFKIGKVKKAFENSDFNEFYEALMRTGIHIVDMSIFEYESIKNMFSLVLLNLLNLFLRKNEITNNPKLIIMIDEAQNIASKENENGILEKMFMELRKYGLGIILACTRPSIINQNILANSCCLILHQILNSYDINYLKNFSIISSNDIDIALSTINEGEAIVKNIKDKKESLIKIGLPEHEFLIFS